MLLCAALSSSERAIAVNTAASLNRISFFRFELDPIIAEKHGGTTEIDNLCLSCPDCNAYKGSDIGSIDPVSKSYTRLFHPRLDIWENHFLLGNSVIEPLTPEGRVTALVLRFNTDERIEDHLLLAEVGRYPCLPPE